MINITISGDGEVIQMIGAKGPKIARELTSEMHRVTLKLLRYVKENKLSGQVLKNRTGTLRRKVNECVTESPNSIVGQVGVRLSYAAAHEYGFDGQETVRAHLRTIKQAFGRPLAEAKEVQVRSFTRHMKIPERSFLRSSLRELKPQIERDLRAAVMRGASA